VNRSELVARVEADHGAWGAIIDQAGGRVDEPGAAGEWTLRDVLAHINAYHRFVIGNLGGDVRGFDAMPDDIGFDVQKRNEWMHAQDLGMSWADVLAEHDSLFGQLLEQVGRRTDEQLQQKMVDWAPETIEEWVLNLTDGHFKEHEPDLRAWLTGPGTRG